MVLRPACAALVLSASLLAGCDPDIRVEVLDTSEACLALLPKPPLRPVTAQVQVPAGAFCGEATTDERGRLYVTERGAALTDWGNWHLFHPDGSYDGSLGGAGRGELAPQFTGFFGVRYDASGNAHLEVLRRGELPSGPPADPLGRPVERVDLSDAPELGSFVVTSTRSSPAGDWAVNVLRHQPWGALYAAQTDVATGPASSAPRNLAGAASVGSQGLAVWETGGALRARFLRLDGGLLGSELAVPGVPPLAPLTLQPLLDNSIALKAAGSWRTRFSLGPSGPSLSAPPAWLASTGDSTLARVRNEQGYAVVPAPGVNSRRCTQQVQVRTPSGTLCGTVTLRQGSGGGPCTTQPITVGRDGSLIEKATRERCADGVCSCTHRMWPGLLR